MPDGAYCFALPSAIEAVMLEYLPLALYVTVVSEGFVHLEVVAQAGKLQAIVAHFLDERCEFLLGKVRPLAGKQGYGSCQLSPL